MDSSFYNAEEKMDGLDSLTICTSNSSEPVSLNSPLTFHFSPDIILDHIESSRTAIARYDLAYYQVITGLERLERIQDKIRGDHVRFCMKMEKDD